MEGRCAFVFFMIFNAILGLSGLALLAAGIALFVINPEIVVSGDTINLKKGYIAMIVIGSYITFLLILGACSWKKSGVLITYFVLALFLIIAELAVIILIKVANNTINYSEITTRDKEVIDLGFLVLYCTFGISLGIAFLSFLCSTIHFCLIRKESGPQLYSDVRNMEYVTMPQYQNV